MKNLSPPGTYKKPLNIFEAIKKKVPVDTADVLIEEIKPADITAAPSHQSEFLFPIRMLF